MSDAIRKLEDVRMTDVAEVGGKAAGLGELLAAGARVPDGVVLTVGGAHLPADERGSLLGTQIAGLGDGPFAVRSSAVGEDSAERSYAGMYESVLNVSAADLGEAMEETLASRRGTRVAGYEVSGGGANGEIAVIVQRMISAVAAGVALTADPITGDRQTCVVTAVRGIADRLVSGAALGDEWAVVNGTATARRQPEHAISGPQAEEVATEARRIADLRGAPQDIEWAVDAEGTLWILQARPMTALPPEVSWDAPAGGPYTRQLRFGEWISGPVTPLFESWLLTAMEERMHAEFLRMIGQRIARPYHVVVNGWYFYSIAWASPAAMGRNLPRILWHLVRSPRYVAGVLPATVRYSFPLSERMWRQDIQPRYRAAVTAAEARADSLPVAKLPALIDELADLAGEYFTWIAALGGAAYKMEVNLAGFYRRHLASSLGGSHLQLLTGFEAPTGPAEHAVATLDWRQAPSDRVGTGVAPATDHARLVATRHAAETAAFEALSSSPRRLAAFRRLLADAQHLVPVREEQAAELTLPWPVMRRAVLRIGEELAGNGALGEPDDVFFLTRDEALAALRRDGPVPAIDVAARRATWEAQARLMPPQVIGRLSPVLKRMWDAFPRTLGAVPSDTALVTGVPASPGRATGPVRVVSGPEEFDALQPGEILVAPLTAPAWTPLFTRAAAVVTDVGSAAAHASIIAREYGIPAVVGCGDATARLTTGMRVTVDGNTGNVEPA